MNTRRASDTATATNGAVVVVHFGQPETTSACVNSLTRCDLAPQNVYVVDNDPVPLGPSFAGRYDHVTVLRPGRNLGFAGGVNVGLRHGLERGDQWFWLLNNDATVRSDSLRRLLEELNASDRPRIIGSLIQTDTRRCWFGGGEISWRTGKCSHTSFGRPIYEIERHGTQSTMWISGCSMMFPASLVKQRGLLDERYFLYKEELEWQLRSWTRDQAVIIGEPLVTHRPGTASRRSAGRVAATFMARNQYLLSRTYAGAWKPLWYLRIAYDYFMRPGLRGDVASMRSSWKGLKSRGTDPAELLAAVLPLPAGVRR